MSDQSPSCPPSPNNIIQFLHSVPPKWVPDSAYDYASQASYYDVYYAPNFNKPGYAVGTGLTIASPSGMKSLGLENQLGATVPLFYNGENAWSGLVRLIWPNGPTYRNFYNRIANWWTAYGYNYGSPNSMDGPFFTDLPDIKHLVIGASVVARPTNFSSSIRGNIPNKGLGGLLNDAIPPETWYSQMFQIVEFPDISTNNPEPLAKSEPFYPGNNSIHKEYQNKIIGQPPLPVSFDSSWLNSLKAPLAILPLEKTFEKQRPRIVFIGTSYSLVPDKVISTGPAWGGWVEYTQVIVTKPLYSFFSGSTPWVPPAVGYLVGNSSDISFSPPFFGENDLTNKVWTQGGIGVLPFGGPDGSLNLSDVIVAGYSLGSCTDKQSGVTKTLMYHKIPMRGKKNYDLYVAI